MAILENKKTESQEIHYSRYIASWRNAGGKYFGGDFQEFLRLQGCTEQEISDITWLGNCGKMELETVARLFLKNKTKNREEE